VEGNAKRVESAYLDTYTKEERQQYEDELWPEESSDPDVATTTTAPSNEIPGPPLPEIVSGSIDFPYVFGEGFVNALVTKNGNDAVNAAFANPPVDEEQVMFPAVYLAGEGPVTVAVPTAPAGETVVTSGTLGTFDIMMVVGTRLGFDRAWEAIRGWGGDSYLVTNRSGTMCVHEVAVGDTPDDTAQLGAAFADWAAGIPGAAGGQDDRGAFLDNCDAGGVAPAQLPEATSTLTLAEIRVYFVDLMQRVLNSTHPAAECVTDAIRSEYGNDGFNDLWTSTDDDDGGFSDTYRTAVRACAGYFPELATFVAPQ
jgi:hypothetical protein